MSTGTYIRKLIYDIGEVLGSAPRDGRARRTRVSNFFEKNRLIKLHDLNSAYLSYKEKKDEEKLRIMISPIEICLTEIPCVVIRDTAVDALCHACTTGNSRNITNIKKT